MHRNRVNRGTLQCAACQAAHRRVQGVSGEVILGANIEEELETAWITGNGRATALPKDVWSQPYPVESVGKLKLMLPTFVSGEEGVGPASRNVICGFQVFKLFVVTAYRLP